MSSRRCVVGANVRGRRCRQQRDRGASAEYTSGHMTVVAVSHTFTSGPERDRTRRETTMTDQLTRPEATTTHTSDEGRFLRWAGWSGLVATFLFLTTVAATFLGGPAQPEGPGDVLGYMSEVAAGPFQNYLYGIAGIAFCVIYIPMLFGVHRLLGRTVPVWFGTAAMVMGMALLLPAYVISTMEPGIGEAAAQLGSAGADAAYAVYGTLATASTIFFTVGSVLTLCFGPLIWSAEALRAGSHARWLGWMGILTGVTGLVWFVWFSESGVILMVLIANVVASLVYFFGLSAVLLGRGRAA